MIIIRFPNLGNAVHIRVSLPRHGTYPRKSSFDPFSSDILHALLEDWKGQPRQRTPISWGTYRILCKFTFRSSNLMVFRKSAWGIPPFLGRPLRLRCDIVWQREGIIVKKYSLPINNGWICHEFTDMFPYEWISNYQYHTIRYFAMFDSRMVMHGSITAPSTAFRHQPRLESQRLNLRSMECLQWPLKMSVARGNSNF